MHTRLLLVLLICTLSSCSKWFGEGEYNDVANAGTYVSEDSLVVGKAGMYTYSIFANHEQPIFDQALIKKYVQRKGYSGFEFDSAVLHGNPGISINFSNNRQVTFYTNTLGASVSGSVVADGRMTLKNEDSIFIYFMLFQSFDQRMATNTLKDSCARLNAQFATCNVSSTQTQAYKQFPVEIVNNELTAVRYVTSYFTRLNNNACSSAFVNEIGYDAERATWTNDTYAIINRFKPGDTLVIQSKKVMLKRK